MQENAAKEHAVSAGINAREKLNNQAGPFTWFVWLLITSPIGLPLWFLGILTGVKRLQTAWVSLANAIISAIHGEQFETDTKGIKPVDFVQHTINSGNLLNVVKYSDGSYHRFVRCVDLKGCAHRVELSQIIPGELQALGLGDTLPMALKYTLGQVRAGIFPALNARGVPLEAAVQASAKTGVAKPAKAGDESAPSEAPTATAQAPKGTANSPVPVATPAHTQAPQVLSALASPTNKPVRAAVGKLVFAGVQKINQDGKDPYTTFVVSVQSDTGECVDFTGFDLKKTFGGSPPEIAVGQRVRIALMGKESFTSERGDGQVLKKTRNVYEIEAL
jgi:hypothetical protein